MTKAINYYQAQKSFNKQKKRLSLRNFNISLIALIIVLSAFHLINISDLTAKGFILKDLKAQSNILSSEKMSYEERINGLQSYYTLNSRAENLEMIAINEIDYLNAPLAAVARK